MPGGHQAFPEKRRERRGQPRHYDRDVSLPERDVLLEHVGFLRALARSLLRSEADADDVVQQTLLTALERPPGRPGNLRAWLAKVMRNLALLTHRRRQRSARREQAAARPEAAPSPADLAARLELERKVVDAVTELEEPFRSTLILHFYDGLRPIEIARHLGVSDSTVRVRLSRALAKVRAKLEERSDRRALSLGLVLLARLPERAAAPPRAGLQWVAVLALCVAGVATAIVLAGRSAPTPTRGGSTARGAPVPTSAGEEDAHPGSGLTVQGRIVDSFDRPRADVLVEALRAWPRGTFTTLADHLAHMTRAPTPLARATTGADGRYRLELPSPGGYVVRAQEEEAVLELAHSLDGLDFRLVGVPETAGRIVDGEGVPLAGVAVLGWKEGRLPRATTTDAHGRFTLAGGGLLLVARQRGHAARLFRERSETFVIARGPALSLQVPAGASVTVIAKTALAAGRADPRGLFRLDEFPPAEGAVAVVQAPGFAPRVVSLPHAGAVQLERGKTLAGVVREGPTPVAGAQVTCLGGYDIARLGFTQLHVVRTDVDGRYRLTGVPRDTVLVTATHPDYLPRGPDLASFLLSHTTDERLGPDLEMVRAVVKRGRVLDAEGRPVAGARIATWPRGLALTPEVRRALARAGLRWTAVSDNEGRFTLRQLPDVALQVVAQHPLRGRSDVLSDAFELRLHPPLVVGGSVVDEYGTPVAGALLTGLNLRAATGPDGRYRLRGRGVWEHDLTVRHPAHVTLTLRARVNFDTGRAPELTLFRGHVIRGRVDPGGALVLVGRRALRARPDGSFELTGLSPGRHRVEIHAAGRVPRFVEAEADGAELDVRLEPAAALLGRVTHAGAPVPDARVHARFESHAIDHAVTDRDGRFRLAAVPERAGFTLVIRHPKYEELRLASVTAGGARRAFELREEQR